MTKEDEHDETQGGLHQHGVWRDSTTTLTEFEYYDGYGDETKILQRGQTYLQGLFRGSDLDQHLGLAPHACPSARSTGSTASEGLEFLKV